MILTLIYKPMYLKEIIQDILNRCLTNDEDSVHLYFYDEEEPV